MKKNQVYFLRKYHSPFFTDKKENEKAIIDCITENTVQGYYVNDPKTRFVCAKEEFSRIFCSKPSLINSN